MPEFFATARPLMQDARQKSFDLSSTTPGDVVEVATASGSVWTFVRTTQSTVFTGPARGAMPLPSGSYMTRMAMMTTSKNAGQILRSWKDISPQMEIQLGESIFFDGWTTRNGQPMHTNAVTGVCLNGQKIF